MGDVEILLNEEGELKVVQHYDLRVLLRRVDIEGLERHRAVSCLNCSHRGYSGHESTRFLRALFLGSLSLAAVRFSMELRYTGDGRLGLSTFPFWPLLVVVTGIVPLAIFIGVVVVWGVNKAMPVMMKIKKMKKTKRRRKEEVKTISGLIQHV